MTIARLFPASRFQANNPSIPDLYLLHAPYGGRTARLGAWQALTEAVAAGKVRSIGVSNFGVHHLDELEQFIKATDETKGPGMGGVLSVNQVELHPWLARPDIVRWCEERGVVLEVGDNNRRYPELGWSFGIRVFTLT